MFINNLLLKVISTRIMRGVSCSINLNIKVHGAAILDKHGHFCTKLDSVEPLGFRLFGCGRIRTVQGVIRIRMKGRYELKGIHYGFIQHGFAKRIRLETAPEIQ